VAITGSAGPVAARFGRVVRAVVRRCAARVVGRQPNGDLAPARVTAVAPGLSTASRSAGCWATALLTIVVDEMEGLVSEQREGWSGPHRACLSALPIEMTAEPAGAWEAGTVPEDEESPRVDPPAARIDATVTALERAVDSLHTLPLEETSELVLRSLLTWMTIPDRRLAAFRTRLIAEVEARAVAAAPAGRHQAARQETRRGLQTQLGVPPSEVKRAAETGRLLRESPAVREDFHAGKLSQAAAGILVDGLRHIPHDRRPDVEAELLPIAQAGDLAALRRAVTRAISREDHEALLLRDQRRRARRSCRLTETEDDALVVHARIYGPDKEIVRTAFDAFDRFDGGDDRRSSEQRKADAFVQLCLVALRSGDAPTQHGVRPHVSVLVDAETARRQTGLVETAMSGPLPIESLFWLFQDCSVTRIELDPDRVPTEIGQAMRNPSTALWRAFVARDRGCTWKGCDAPPAWCQVAHGMIPWHLSGKLTLSDAALLCHRHHRLFDQGGWRMVIAGAEVSYVRDPSVQPVHLRTLQATGPP
jgi:hypothetical protein